VSISHRLFNALRANLNHAVRSLRSESYSGARSSEFSDFIDQDNQDSQAETPQPSRGGATRESQEKKPGSNQTKQSSLRRDYRALELPYGADREAIRRAHRKLLRQFHPDRFANQPSKLEDATRLSQELSLARDRLLAAHDLGLINPE